MYAALDLLALIFIHPMRLPPGARLWTLLPLVLCVALVYRATRARTARELPLPTFISFLTILVGMSLIAGGFYALHQLVIRWSA